MNAWVKGLLAAAIGGAANTITVVIVDPVNFNLVTGAGKVATVAAVGALLSVAAFLQKSPIPEEK
jgi:hypothetical protein